MSEPQRGKSCPARNMQVQHVVKRRYRKIRNSPLPPPPTQTSTRSNFDELLVTSSFEFGVAICHPFLVVWHLTLASPSSRRARAPTVLTAVAGRLAS